MNQCSSEIRGSAFILVLSFFISSAALAQVTPYLHKFSSGMNYSFLKKASGNNKQASFFGMSPAASSLAVTTGQVISPGTITLTVDYTGTTCGYSNGSFNASASGGTPPYLFSENGYPDQSSGYFGQKAPGSYTITVKDANGLTNTATVVLTNTYPGFSVTENDIKAPACTGDDGSVLLTVTGGTPPFQYGLNGVTWQSGNTLTNLRPGLYTFAVKDANGCRNGVNSNFFGYQCGINGYAYTQLICLDHTGEIGLYVIPGITSLTFSLDNINYQSNPEFTGLDIGDYTVYVKDGPNLVSIFNLHIGIYCSISVVAVTTDATCGNHDGIITATGSNGIAPYSYSLDGQNFQSGSVFAGLAPGTYIVTVKDITGAYNTTQAIVYDGCPTAAATAINSVCGQPNGVITVTATRGTAPYSYSIDGTNFQSGNVFSGLSANTYTLTVKDANGFTAGTTCLVGNVCLTVTATPTDGTCGNDNGSLLAAGSGGTVPYQYSIDGVNFQSSAAFNKLSKRQYTVTVRDAGGLSATTTVAIDNIPGPVFNNANPTAASCSNNDGTLTINAGGGQAPLSYAVDGGAFQSGPTITSLSSGPHTITINDANNCQARAVETIPIQNTIKANAGSDQIICEGELITLYASTDGNSFTWLADPSLSDMHSLTPQAKPSVTTTYHFLGMLGSCTTTAAVTIIVNPAPIADAGPDAATCYGKDIRLQGNGGLVYAWSPAQYLSDVHVAAPVVKMPEQSMTYSLSVTDGNGCPSLNTAKVHITVTPPPRITIGNDTSIAVGQPLQLKIDDINNSGFTSYQWSPAYGLDNPYSPNPIAVLDGNTTYVVKATAPGDCIALGTIGIKVYAHADIYVPNAFSPNGDGHNDLLRTIVVGIKDFKYFMVYDRWGQLVFKTTDPSKGWDGTVRGQIQGSNTFVWMAAGTDYTGKPIQKTGTVSLIR